MKHKQAVKAIFLTAAITLLIIDYKQSSASVAEGLELCMKTVIPALFPLMFLTSLLSASQIYCKFRILNWIGLPEGTHDLFLLGLISGYPVGAQLVQSAYQSNRLPKTAAQRLLSFCNNPGPSFIFGMLSPLFENPFAPLCLWIIVCASAFLTGLILPGKGNKSCHPEETSTQTVSEILLKTVKAMAMVCGWVILFRVLFNHLETRVLFAVPDIVSIIIAGIGEITNGCIALKSVDNEATRFILCAGFLTFGGLCVTMQTAAVAKDMKISTYLRGKCLQSLLAIILAAVSATWLF